MPVRVWLSLPINMLYRNFHSITKVTSHMGFEIYCKDSSNETVIFHRHSKKEAHKEVEKLRNQGYTIIKVVETLYKTNTYHEV